MPPLFPLLFALLFLVGAGAGALFRTKPLAGAVMPASLATGALFLTDWDFTIDTGAIAEFFLPAFLFAVSGGLCGLFAGRKAQALLQRGQ